MVELVAGEVVVVVEEEAAGPEAWAVSLIAYGSGCPPAMAAMGWHVAHSEEPQPSAQPEPSSAVVPTKTATTSGPVAMNGFFSKDFATILLAHVRLT
jgi:hypothetical protein